MAGLLDTIRSRVSNDPVAQYIIDTYRGAGGLLSDIAQSPQAQYFAGQFAPGAGSLDFSGQMPLAPTGEQSIMDVYAAPDRLPSFKQNLSQGNYFDALLQGLGATGDYASAIPVLGTVLKAPKAIQRTIKARKPINQSTQNINIDSNKIDPKFSSRIIYDDSNIEGGKVSNEAQRLNKLTGVVESRNLDVPEISIYDLEGKPFITSMYDRTAAGGLLTKINDIDLNDPVNLRGGQDYMFDLMNSGQVTASEKNVISQIIKYAEALKKNNKGVDPVFIPWRMSPSGGDYSTQTTEAMLKYAAQNMSKEEIKEFNRVIRKEGRKVAVTKPHPTDKEKTITESVLVKIPKFKGIENPESIDQLYNTLSAKEKTAIQELFDKSFRDRGSLSLPEARLLVSDQTQLLAPTTGIQNVGQIDLSRGLLDFSGHPTYSTGLAGEGIGRIKEDVQIYQLMPEVAAARKAAKKKTNAYKDPRSPSSGDVRALVMKPYGGVITDKVLKNLGL